MHKYKQQLHRVSAKRITHIVKQHCFTMCVLFLAIIAGCSRTDEDLPNHNFNNTNDFSYPFDINRADEIGDRPEFDIPRRVKQQRLFSELQGIAVLSAAHNNGIYVYTETVDEYGNHQQYYFCNLDDGTVEQSFVLPDNFAPTDCHAFEDGTLLILGSPAKTNELGQAAGWTGGYSLYKLSENNTLLLYNSTDADLTYYPIYTGNTLTIDEHRQCVYASVINNDTGNFAIRAHSIITGDVLFEIETNGNSINDIIYNEQNETVYVSELKETNITIYALDYNKQKLIEVASLPEMGSASLAPGKTYGFYVVRDKVLAFDTQSNIFIELFNLNQYGISGWTPLFFEYNGDYVVFSTAEPSGIYRITLYEDYDGPVEELRLANLRMGDPLLNQMVLDFNFYNPQYNLEVVDYWKYGDEAASRLNTDILSNNAPDILLMSDPILQEIYMPVHHYIANKSLVDLAPYMARDLDPSKYWVNAMRSLHTGNECYIAVPSFSVYAGIIGDSATIQDYAFSGVSDFFDFLKEDFQSSSPQVAVHMTQEQFFVNMVLANISSFVNYSTREADFINDDFIALLEATAALKYVDSDDAFAINDIMSLARKDNKAAFLNIRHFGDLDIYAHALYGDFDVAYMGGSTAAGTALIPLHIFGVSSHTDNVEGAWAFLRTLYEYDEIYQNIGMSIPMNKTSFKVMSDDYTQIRELSIANNDKGPIFWGTSDEAAAVGVPLISRETVFDIVKCTQDIVENIDRLYLNDLAIQNIMIEEIYAYLSNLISAEDTARVIQNRVQTYLWEIS